MSTCSEPMVETNRVIFGSFFSCTRKATAALLAKRKPNALGYLKSRKLLEDVLNKRLASLHILESTFIAVETAAGDVGVREFTFSQNNTSDFLS